MEICDDCSKALDATSVLNISRVAKSFSMIPIASRYHLTITVPSAPSVLHSSP